MASSTSNGPTHFAANFLLNPGAIFKCSVLNHARYPTLMSTSRLRLFACCAMVMAACDSAPLTSCTVDYMREMHSATASTGQSVTARTACSNGKTGSLPYTTYAGECCVALLQLELSANSARGSMRSQLLCRAVTRQRNTCSKL